MTPADFALQNGVRVMALGRRCDPLRQETGSFALAVANKVSPFGAARANRAPQFHCAP